MIPQKIHYCWFGHKKKPSSIQHCIESWQKFFPNFTIKEWNETNFNVNSFTYTKEAYASGKYAFVSDVARLHALITEGGIYFDTDVTVLKEFPKNLFEFDAFAGFEMEKYVGTAVLASKPFHAFFSEILDDYRNRHFDLILKKDTTSNVETITKRLVSKGLIQNNLTQNIANIQIYPQSYFCNKNYQTKEYYTSDESLAIHDFSGSWCSTSFIGKVWTLLHLPQTNICGKIAPFLKKIIDRQ